MKVRHKRGVMEGIPVLEESDNFYIVKGPAETFAAPKTDWEPFTEPTFRDVTGECEVDGGGNVFHDGKRLTAHTDFTNINGLSYRLRKVKVLTGPEEVPEWVFKVEKREP